MTKVSNFDEQVQTFAAAVVNVVTALSPLALILICLGIAGANCYLEYLFQLSIFGDFALLPAILVGGFRFASGMGGVALATADDGSAMLTNPAALARLRRIEVSGGFLFEGQRMQGDALGGEYDTEITSTSLSALRFAYPFPTFRGSLVVGLGLERVYGLDDDFLATYDDSLTWYEPSAGEAQTAVWRQTEDLLSSGDMYAGTVAVAFDASENVSLGAALSIVGGSYERAFLYTARDEFDASEDYETYTLQVDSEADVTGLSVKMGGLFYVSEDLAAGLTVQFPTTLTFSGTERERQATAGDVEDDETTVTSFEDELTLPFTFGAGASWTPFDLLMVGCDYHYTNWSEMEYEGRVYLGDQSERRDAYDAVHDLRAGVELTVPEMPIRVRAGYMSHPIAYRGLSVDADRAYWTVGAGILIDTVLAIDVAWLTAAYERSADEYDYDEAVDETALVIEAAYRF